MNSAQRLKSARKMKKSSRKPKRTPDVALEITREIIPKSNEAADRYRKQGNEDYRSGEHFEALCAYNKSIRHALSGSEQLALGYANRSAVYVHSKMYAKSIANIKLAREHGYPAAKLSRLRDREELCEKMIADGEETTFDHWSFFKLSHPANEHIPFIINCLELRENVKYGRHIVTTKDLKTGDIISIEEPVFSILDENAKSNHCSFCMKSNKLSLIPCTECTTGKICFH